MQQVEVIRVTKEGEDITVTVFKDRTELMVFLDPPPTDLVDFGEWDVVRFHTIDAILRQLTSKGYLINSDPQSTQNS